MEWGGLVKWGGWVEGGGWVSKSNDGGLVFNAFINIEYVPRGRHAQ